MIKLSKTPFEELCGMQCIVGNQKCPAYDVCPSNKAFVKGMFTRYFNCCRRELKYKNQVSLVYQDLEKLVRWSLSGGFRCPICNETMEINNGHTPLESKVYSIEHIKSMGKGGDNTTDNMIICCRKCNKENNERDQINGFIVEE